MWILLIIIIGIGIWLVQVYNHLQSSMQAIREQLSNLHAALKKRIDLANQVIDIAQGYAEHEKLTHLSVSKALEAKEHMAALSQAYPALRANQTYQNLMMQLENLEQTILERRERYNARVRQYNSYRNNFPAVLVAQKLSFSTAPYFEMDDPDFMEKVKLFERDDTQALQQLMTASGEAISKHTAQARERIQQEYQRHTQSDHTQQNENSQQTVKPQTAQNDELMTVSQQNSDNNAQTTNDTSIEETSTNNHQINKPNDNVG